MTHRSRALGAVALDVAARRSATTAFFFVDLLRALPARAAPAFTWSSRRSMRSATCSLVIILASGLAVGFVLALQMYYALVTYGAAESLGLIVNLSLVRELGPVVTALLFAGRAGTSLTAEIGLMKAGEQLAAMEHDGASTRRAACSRRAFSAASSSMPILAILFSAVGILGAYVVAVLLIGVDAGNFWSIMQSRRRRLARCRQRHRQERRVRRDLHLRRAVPGLRDARPTPEGVAHATTRTVVISSLAVLGMDFVLTAMMFSTPGADRAVSIGLDRGWIDGQEKASRRWSACSCCSACSALLFLALKAANLGQLRRRRHLHADRRASTTSAA